MTARIETRRFAADDPEAHAFYRAHGYAVLQGVLRDSERASIRPAWDRLVADAADAVSMPPAEFEERFPQNRDLWSKCATFRSLLFETRQAEVARRFLGVAGVRLFHDHAIAKPAGRSGTIPWHQDSAYWPLDRAGNSLWTPTASVAADGGCLKVLDGSHRDGPGVPQDFLRPAGVDRDADPRMVRVPVQVGDTVVLHGLTWHASDPNVGAVDRLAYLTLWVPASARFAPAHAGWHPSAAHVDVPPGEPLDGAWFPLFGQVGPDDEGEPVAFASAPVGEGPTMFKASDAIRAQLRWLAGEPRASMPSLVAEPMRSRVAARAEAEGLVRAGDAEVVVGLLERLALQEVVRRRFVARDVYLTTVQEWWHLLGHRVAARMTG